MHVIQIFYVSSAFPVASPTFLSNSIARLPSAEVLMSFKTYILVSLYMNVFLLHSFVMQNV
jgi:hypothetical protein